MKNIIQTDKHPKEVTLFVLTFFQHLFYFKTLHQSALKQFNTRFKETIHPVL